MLLIGSLILEVLLLAMGAGMVIIALAHVLSDTTDVPFVKTPPRMYPLIAEALEITPGDTVYELGSGDGSFLLWCAEHYPEAEFVGIERNPLLCLFAQWRGRNSTRVRFVRDDIFAADFSQPTKIYAYLLPRVMDALLPKLEISFRGTLASRAFRFRAKENTATIELSSSSGKHGQHVLHVYQFGDEHS